LVSLRWDQVDFAQGTLHVNRAKNGIASVHPLGGEEIRALRRVKREGGDNRYIFVTERDGPMTAAGFRKMLARTGEASGLSFPVHPHMLRHAAGYKLANQRRRYAFTTALPRPQKHSAYGPVQRACCRPV
jgi:type 1 fimbriae regulatory protein FimB/type 1 fimbriae regulatory protein FimE